MEDRLENIKELHENNERPVPGMAWLIAEVERLREKLIECESRNHDLP